MYYGDTEKHIVLQRITDCLFVNTKRYNLIMFFAYLVSVVLFFLQEFFFNMIHVNKRERDKKGILTCNILYMLILTIFMRLDLISMKNDYRGHFESFYNSMSFIHFFIQLSYCIYRCKNPYVTLHYLNNNPNSNQEYNHDTLSDADSMSTLALFNTIIMIFIGIKFMYFLQINNQFGQINRLIHHTLLSIW